MPRFNPEKWKPEHESSPGVFHLDPERVVLLRVWYGDNLSCPCGCGEALGDKSKFRMGHDARFRGILIRAHLMGVEVRWARDDGSLTDAHTAMVLAQDYGWQEYLTNAALRREGKNRELLRRALSNPDLLKAGKWAYTGGQVVVLFKPDPRKNTMDVMYVNQAGDIKKMKVPADQAEEIVK
jgi:hypothetical protein